MAYMYTMAATARITLQLARKYPAQVSPEELAEAEDFLMTIISVLQPICEDNSNLDSQMGIPQPLADDFRNRAFNRALNGIGTIGMATAALQDLQLLNGTTTYQSTIDRYRKVIEEYIENWKSTGFQETVDGKDYFSYPYSASDNGYWNGDVKLFGADDKGHFSHSMQGCYVLYDSVPELGVDDAFMTAIANTIYFNTSTTSGSPQTPNQEAIRPYSRHPYSSDPSPRFYMLEAFKDGTIDAQCTNLNASSKESSLSEYESRLATLNAHYLKALREDRTRIHLAEGDATPPAPPTGLAETVGDGAIALNWDDNGESDLFSYNVYRTTASGSYTTALITGLSASEYVDTTVTNGTTYYYVVTAIDTDSNESEQSAEVSATPVVLPVVSITSPIDSATYIAPANVTVDVSATYDGGSITKVELWNNGALVGTDTAAPYSFSLTGLSGGTYTLEARAYHDQLSASDEVEILVRQNEPPAVETGVNQTIEMPTDTVNLDATVTDDGLPEGVPVTTTWSKVSGSGSVTFGDAFSIDTTATFRETGTYVLRLTADDTEFSATDDVQIVVDPFNPSQTLTFEPIEDAYLQGGSRYNDSYLKVDPGIRVSYMKFAVSGITGSVTDVKLTMKQSSDTGNGTFRLYRGSHNNWTEDNLSTSIAPAEDVLVGTRTENVTNAETVVFNVDSLVTENGEVSVIIKMDNGGNDAWFSSKEGSTPPVLEVTFDAVLTGNLPPTGLTASASDGSITLDWDDSFGGDLAGYSVYRSTTSGSYGTALATGLQSSEYADSSVVNGTTYYYVVTATDTTNNESEPSSEVTATPNGFSGNAIIFGSDFDGLGGFTHSTSTANQIWTTQTNSVRYRNQDTNMSNSSFLKEIPINRADGNSYTIWGTVHLTDGYADDNARVGIYLFGDSSAIPDAEEAGALCLLYNFDTGAVSLMEGIQKTTISSSSTGRYNDDSIFGNTVTFTTNITFSGSDILIAGVFTDEFGASTTVDATVAAAGYTGDYFGFVTRNHSRNYGVSGDPRSAPFVADYESFSLSWDNEPLEGYRQWAEDWGIGKDASGSDDYDGDGMSNFAEFGLGGDPDDRLNRGMLPTFTRAGNTGLFIYPCRNDSQDITYRVETHTSLSPDTWSATRYTIGDTVSGDGTYDFVTVHVDTDEPSLYVRLVIESETEE